MIQNSSRLLGANIIFFWKIFEVLDDILNYKSSLNN